jgi:hypothetical protein
MSTARELFADWLQRQGHRVVETASSGWYEPARGALQAFPYHHLVAPAPEELDSLLRANRALALRYSAAPYERGQASYHVVLADKSYDLHTLGRKARRDVVAGLEQARIERIEFSEMAVSGWRLRASTLERQRRHRAESELWWRRLCAASEAVEGFEAWTAIVNGRPAASLIAFVAEGCCSILYQQSDAELLSAFPNHALTFALTRSVLRREDVREVFYGLHSLDAPGSVDAFKFRLGFQARRVRQHVCFHPWIAPMVTPATQSMVLAARALAPWNHRLAKLEGLVRFSLSGRTPDGVNPPHLSQE